MTILMQFKIGSEQYTIETTNSKDVYYTSRLEDIGTMNIHGFKIKGNIEALIKTHPIIGGMLTRAFEYKAKKIVSSKEKAYVLDKSTLVSLLLESLKQCVATSEIERFSKDFKKLSSKLKEKYHFSDRDIQDVNDAVVIQGLEIISQRNLKVVRAFESSPTKPITHQPIHQGHTRHTQLSLNYLRH